jgi:hypothetical protein
VFSFLLTLHLLTHPMPSGPESRLQLLPELHLQSLGQTGPAAVPVLDRTPLDTHGIETLVGSAVLLGTELVVGGVATVLTVAAVLLLFSNSTTSTGIALLLAVVVAGGIFEVAAVPLISAGAVWATSRGRGDPGSFGGALLGAAIGNVPGLAALILSAYIEAQLTNSSSGSTANTHQGLALVSLGLGLVVQAGCVALGASLGAHWDRTPAQAPRPTGPLEPLPVPGVVPPTVSPAQPPRPTDVPTMDAPAMPPPSSVTPPPLPPDRVPQPPATQLWVPVFSVQFG